MAHVALRSGFNHNDRSFNKSVADDLRYLLVNETQPWRGVIR